MRRRKVQKQQPEERKTLADSNAPEVPFPRAKLKSISSSDWGDNNGDVDGEVGNDNTDVSPSVWKQFGQGKGGQLL